ncbi:hypothetical protein ABVT39_007802 [Epinephelus coioides]
MLAVCESCFPTLSKLRESISGLQANLKEREKILLDFTTIATTQEKHIAHLTASGAGDRSMMATNNTTLPWTGSITTGTPTPALAKSRWHRRGAKPKSSAPSTSCLRPTEPQCFITEGGAGAPMSSTPLKPRKPWSVVARGSGARPSPPPLPPELPLDNRYDILSLQVFPPMDASSSLPVEPVGLHPAGRGSHQSRNRRLLVQPDPSPPSRSGGTAAWRHKHRTPSRHRRTSRQSEARTREQRTREQRTPSVLVIATSMVRQVEVHNGRTFCHPGARVSEFASSALQLAARHSSASSLVLEAGINNLRNQQSEVLKQDFISLVDRLLDTGKRLIISGPLPPPHYGDVTISHLRQLHLWLKGHCLSKSIPFVDNFIAFLNRPHLFKRDGLRPNQEGSRLLSVNTDLTVRSCTTATS